MPSPAHRVVSRAVIIALIAALWAIVGSSHAWAAKALVANSGAVDGVTFFDLDAGTSILITHDEFKGPRYVAITGDGRFGAVANGDGGTVSWVDLRVQSAPVYLGKTFVGANPRAIAIRNNIAVVAVNDPAAGSMDFLKIIAIGALPNIPHDPEVTVVPIGVDANPEGVAITPDGHYVLVTASPKKLLYVDLTGLAPALLPGFTKIKKGPFSVAIDPAGTKAIVTGNTMHTLSIVDLTGLPTLPDPTKVTRFTIGASPMGVAITPDAASAVVAEAGDPDAARVVDLTDLTSAPVLLGTPANPDPNPFGVAAWNTPGGARAIVTNTTAETLSIVDVATDTVVATIDSGPGPRGVAVIPALPPVASLVASVTSGKAPLAVTFDGSKSFDRNGVITTYAFDFGDGTTLSSPTPVVTHTYQAIGKFTASLVVTDDDLTSSSKSTTSVEAQENKPPKATLRVNPTSGRVPLVVTLDGSRSSDSDGRIAAYTFAFGDGTTLVSPDPIVTHTYATAGNYDASLIVTDDNGATSTKASGSVQAKANELPTAGFRVKPASGPVPLISLFTDQSKDSDGKIVGYLWDFGDGGTSAERNPIHVYRTPGSYVVTLTVTDDSGATAKKTGKVEARSR